eukprot:CAMPEP_0178948922 /NCGR_PEP_ID=MMETSP0789-20121207/5742_1 /TAXON_ID=3005 /ORGANISM="Rhizosolenia setigera, Strain CCMP 1694" /LENGTH=683 /DNA_ID=CAMNT_0020629343 /DNA_START=36 /DNA_END=2087 /DNA_ORIENTATION=+
MKRIRIRQHSNNNSDDGDIIRRELSISRHSSAVDSLGFICIMLLCSTGCLVHGFTSPPPQIVCSPVTKTTTLSSSTPSIVHSSLLEKNKSTLLASSSRSSLGNRIVLQHRKPTAFVPSSLTLFAKQEADSDDVYEEGEGDYDYEYEEEGEYDDEDKELAEDEQESQDNSMAESSDPADKTFHDDNTQTDIGEEVEDDKANDDQAANFLIEMNEGLQKINELDSDLQKLESFTDFDELINDLTPEQKDVIENDPVEALAEKEAEPYTLAEEDIASVTKEDILKALKDAAGEDEFPPDGDWIYGDEEDVVPLKQKDLIELNEVQTKLNEIQEEIRTGVTKIENVDLIDDEYMMRYVLDEQTANEIMNLDDEVLVDDDGQLNEEELHKQRKQLIYDLDYNVTNLFLASLKVNPDAPVILDQWMYQLRNYTRYEYVRLQNFNFTWDDVDNSDVTELEAYYKGTGIDEIPKPNRLENPNVIEWDEKPLTFEEEQILALENWMEEVYQDEDDITLDDEELMPEDNPAAPEHGFAQEDQADPVMKDVKEFEDKYQHMSQDWRDQYVERKQLEVVNKLDSDFRGHLVIACSPTQEDINLASKLTERMDKEFGEQVYVETRVIGHAKPQDYLYEIWIESWEVKLLHSKRRAVFQRDWEGARDITDEVMDSIVEQVEFWISDKVKYSFFYESD